MSPLSEEDKARIKRILQKANKKIWQDHIVEKVIENIERLRSGELRLSDWFIPEVMDYESYIYQLSLHKFVT